VASVIKNPPGLTRCRYYWTAKEEEGSKVGPLCSPNASQGGEDNAMLEGAVPTQSELSRVKSLDALEADMIMKAHHSRWKKKTVAAERLSRSHNNVKQVDNRKTLCWSSSIVSTGVRSSVISLPLEEEGLHEKLSQSRSGRKGLFASVTNRVR
jgi:hypothetical protein